MKSSAWEAWLQDAAAVYEAGDPQAVLDRAIRARGTAEEIILSYAILKELRALRRALVPSKQMGRPR